jgi:hypothetical protein
MQFPHPPDTGDLLKQGTFAMSLILRLGSNGPCWFPFSAAMPDIRRESSRFCLLTILVKSATAVAPTHVHHILQPPRLWPVTSLAEMIFKTVSESRNIRRPYQPADATSANIHASARPLQSVGRRVPWADRQIGTSSRYTDTPTPAAFLTSCHQISGRVANAFSTSVLAYFPHLKNKSRLTRSPCCLCLPPSTFEYLNQAL